MDTKCKKVLTIVLIHVLIIIVVFAFSIITRESMMDVEVKQYAWGIGAFTADYLEAVPVLLYGISRWSAVTNIFVITSRKNSVKRMKKFRTLFPGLNINYIRVDSVCKGGGTFGGDTKLHIWETYKYGIEQLVYTDVDVVFIQGCDELFNLTLQSNEVGAVLMEPEVLFSGTMVIRPNRETYETVMSYCDPNHSAFSDTCDDQEVLRLAYSEGGIQLVGISHIYNNAKTTWNIDYDTRLFHFNGKCKPWNFNDPGCLPSNVEFLVDYWEHINQKLQKMM